MPIPLYARGSRRTFSIDQSKHSLFGASKVAADVMVQEYGRYFGLPTCCLRGGCLTGPGAFGRRASWIPELSREGQRDGWRLFGVRLWRQAGQGQHPLAGRGAIRRAIHRGASTGRGLQLGGGRENSCSILEAFTRVENLTGRPMQWRYVDQPREGDHICYISDLSKMKAHYPGWSIQKSLDDIFSEIVDGMDRAGWRRLQATMRRLQWCCMIIISNTLPAVVLRRRDRLPGVVSQARRGRAGHDDRQVLLHHGAGTCRPSSSTATASSTRRWSTARPSMRSIIRPSAR